jgi:RND family efflux transporter MFP subunit
MTDTEDEVVSAKGSWGASILRSSTFCVAVVCLIAGCRNDTRPSAPLTRVNAVTAEIVDFAPTITLTGFIEARIRTDLSFRIGGKVSERLANIGDHVTKGQVLARLDPDEQESELVAARASVASAEASLRQTTAALERQKDLLGRGNTTRRDYDQADTDMRAARAQLDQARSDLTLAESQLSYTELTADADGIILEKHIEVGQVVSQAQPIYALARDGARDAVFNVHEWALGNAAADKNLEISLVSDPAVQARGDVREVSPAVNPATETVSVKVALANTPPAMTLGALVNGIAPMKTQKVVLLPWGALFEIAGAPAVWVIDAANGNTVSLKPIALARYTKDRIAVASGLQPGEVVVSAGTQLLRPGQKVEIAAGPK